MAFALHPRLAADCALVKDLALSRALWMNDARFPWLILVPRREDVRELFELEPAARAQLMEEIAHASQTLQRLTQADKINVAALGNLVPQLHVHIIARFSADSAWPAPVWSATAPPAAYEASVLKNWVEKLQSAL